jgi:hypothetical protein
VTHDDEVLRPVGPATRFALPWGKEKVTLTLRKAGYADSTLTFAPDHDGTYSKKLVPLPVRKPSGGSVHKASAPEPHPPEVAVPEPKPVPVKPVVPKSQSGDLMDPFAGKTH